MTAFSIFEMAYMVAMTIALAHFHAKTRQRMMAMKVVAGGFIMFYYWGIGVETAMYAASIATFGSLMQAAFPDHLLERTRMLRSSVAVVLAIAAIAMAAESSFAALPLVATICSRFFELQSCTQRIRLGWLFSQILWLMYFAGSGLILPYLVEHLNVLSNLKAVWSHEQRRKALFPMPAHASLS